MPYEYRPLVIAVILFLIAGGVARATRKIDNQWLQWIPSLAIAGLAFNFVPNGWIFLVFYFPFPILIALLVYREEKSIGKGLLALILSFTAISMLTAIAGVTWHFMFGIATEMNMLMNVASRFR
jgi:hypothetical protein